MKRRVASKELIELGERVRNRRQEIHMSQETVAEKAGISVNTVSRIEGGQTAMSVGIFRKLVEVLAIDANELLNVVSNTNEIEQRHRISHRIRHLSQYEQETVLRIVGVLVERLNQCK